MKNFTRVMLEDMLAKQQELNDSTNGIEWVKGYTKEGRVIDWNRCITVETVELIDSFNWKHWKDINLKDDIENAKMEVVDLWHFLLSLELKNKTGSIEELSENLYKTIISITVKEPKERPISKRSVYDNADKILGISVKKGIPREMVRPLLNIMWELDLTMEGVYKLYMAKNFLNSFRQDNGYKNGTYKKILKFQRKGDSILEDLEDNEVLMYFLERFSVKEAFEKFEDIYRRNTKGVS
jgi:dimeric dUTPase (all-alpha-NTP-PPase superfamily)